MGHGRASTTLDVYVKPLRRLGVTPAMVHAMYGPCPWDAARAPAPA
jgi:hypothetical protein